MKVTKISILVQKGNVDYIRLHTDMPSVIFPEFEEFQVFTTETAQGKGEGFVKEHFPNIPYEVIGL